MTTKTEPTSDDCENRRLVQVLIEGRLYIGHACFYPQMGGYGGRALVVKLSDLPDACFDVYVWHDGEFPFGPDDKRSPAHLHHCFPSQFIRFGEFVAGLGLHA